MTDYSMPGMTGYELLKKIKVWILLVMYLFLEISDVCIDERGIILIRLDCSVWNLIDLVINLYLFLLISAGIISF